MEKDQLNYKEILTRYLENKCSPEEADEIFDFLQKDASNRMLLEKMKEEFKNATPVAREHNGRLRGQLLKMIKPAPVVPLYQKGWARVAIAAAVILLVFTGYYLLTDQNSGQTVNPGKLVQADQDILPGGDKAVLTLGDGRRILLDTAGNGALTQQGNSRVIKLNSGQLAYNSLKDPVTTSVGDEVLYNTITTPRGGQFQVVLPDGSKVWLNAASSLRFPTDFTGDERLVEITGEAYFEVAKFSSSERGTMKGSMPFIVQLQDGSQIRVLGTHFNINAYTEEASVNTTLLEGSVLVKKGSTIKKLAPGQQARMNAMDMDIVNNVDLEQVVAWKNGLFNFHGESLQSAMRQISRWYDVEVVYEKSIPDIRFGGKIQRNLKLQQIINGLEDAEVHFRIEGKKLIVSQ
jgi:transmembrane sensor